MKISWECQELNLGPLGAKPECYPLCSAAPSPLPPNDASGVFHWAKIILILVELQSNLEDLVPRNKDSANSLQAEPHSKVEF